MENYIGVKLLQAEPMNLGAYNQLRGWDIPKDEAPNSPGYLVEYPDGYRSWSPKAVFEAAYFKVDGDGSKVTDGMVEAFLGVCESSQVDDKTTLVKAETITGFVQYEVSSCVDPKNFDMEIGTDICKERIKKTLWKCLGFVLQWGRFGLKAE